MADDRGRLSAADRVKVVLEVLLTYGYARIYLRRHDLPSAVAKLRTRGQSAGALPIPDDAQRVVYASLRVLTPLPADSRCLMRSLVVLGLLARRGIETQLVIGVDVASGFAAHAWVERDGLPLLPAGAFAAGRLTSL